MTRPEKGRNRVQFRAVTLSRSFAMRSAILGFTALLATSCVPADGAYYDPSPYPGTAYPASAAYPAYPSYGGYGAAGGSVYYAGRDSPWDRCRARYSESYCRGQFRDDGDRDRNRTRDRNRDDDNRDRDRDGNRDRDRDRGDRERRSEAERDAERARREQARQEANREQARQEANREQARREAAARGQPRQERRRDPGVTRDGWENSPAGDHARSEFNRLSGKGE